MSTIWGNGPLTKNSVAGSFGAFLVVWLLVVAQVTLTIERLPTLYLYYKINVYVHGRRNGSKNLWRISEAGECTSELLELTSRDCAQLLLGCRRAASCFFKWRPGLFFFCHGHCWLLNRRITETPWLWKPSWARLWFPYKEITNRRQR